MKWILIEGLDFFNKRIRFIWNVCKVSTENQLSFGMRRKKLSILSYKIERKLERL